MNSGVAQQTEPTRFTPFSLVAFLFGSRQAIRAALDCRWLFGVAVLLTISAGFAREYDGEYLAAKPWYLAVPLLVSLSMGSALYLVLISCLWRSLPKGVSPGRAWLGFLTCYLLLAPTAWLYAIPYERWYDELTATRCNLNTLSLVSVWRVLVIARVAGVLFNRSMIAALCPVLLFASSATVIGLMSQIRLPEIMGGVRLSDVEVLIRAYTGNWSGVAFYSFPIWVIGSVIAALYGEAVERKDRSAARRFRPSRGLWCVVVASILVWAPLLGEPQREQRNRYEVERLFEQSEIDAALRRLSDSPESDFPPLWRPPPLGYGNRDKVSLVEVLGHFTANMPSTRIRRMYLDKLALHFSNHANVRFMFEPQDWILLSSVLRRIPEGPEIARAADRSALIWARDDRPDGLVRTAIQEILDLGVTIASQPVREP